MAEPFEPPGKDPTGYPGPQPQPQVPALARVWRAAKAVFHTLMTRQCSVCKGTGKAAGYEHDCPVCGGNGRV